MSAAEDSARARDTSLRHSTHLRVGRRSTSDERTLRSVGSGAARTPVDVSESFTGDVALRLEPDRKSGAPHRRPVNRIVERKVLEHDHHTARARK